MLLECFQIETIGELNYVITSIINRVFSQTEQDYAQLNAVIGMLENVKLEFYRRKVTPYEDIKIKQNGDVT